MGRERGDGKGRGRGEARRGEGGTEAGTEAGAGGGSVIGDDRYGKYDLWNDILDNVARIEERSLKKIIAMLDPMHSNLSYTILVVFWT
jgi:hypothetical protein